MILHGLSRSADASGNLVVKRLRGSADVVHDVRLGPDTGVVRSGGVCQ